MIGWAAELLCDKCTETMARALLRLEPTGQLTVSLPEGWARDEKSGAQVCPSCIDKPLLVVPSGVLADG